MAESPTPSGASTANGTIRRSSRERARLLAIAILAVVATLFAVFNLDKVEVNLLLGSARLPLIVVIVGCLVIGAAIGALLSRRGRKRS